MREIALNEAGKNGLYVAGDGNYLFNFEDMAKTTSGAGYSKTYGSVVQGKRMQVSLRLKPRGSGSRLHTHKNEQFNWIVKGTLRVKIGDGAEVLASAGTLIYVPASVPHTMIATADEDVLYFVCKDMSDLIYGKAVDGADSGPHYDPGFQPEKHVD
jgi:mannose-6-phosphate isomerase-like protein (cupin superfamily)